MRVLKWGIGLILLLAAVAVIGGMLLPREVTVSRSVEIDAPATEIFPHINSLKAAAAWSPWLGLDSGTTLVYSGPEAGAGAVLQWDSEHPQVGSGRQEITASTEPIHVEAVISAAWAPRRRVSIWPRRAAPPR